MVEIQKKFRLHAGHRLIHHDGGCGNLHGHSYKFKISIKGVRSKKTGMVVDFAHVKDPVMDAFDHNMILNEAEPIFDGSNVNEEQEKNFYWINSEPTAENISKEAIKLVFESLTDDEKNRVSQIKVELWETDTSKVLKKAVVDEGLYYG